MEVDSFRYLSSLIKRYYQLNLVGKELPIPSASPARFFAIAASVSFVAMGILLSMVSVAEHDAWPIRVAPRTLGLDLQLSAISQLKI